MTAAREDFGPNGNIGIIGWYVPPWLAKAHPDILDCKNLNKYADEFETSESGGKGQFLGADPSYVQFDEAIISNLKLELQGRLLRLRGRQHQAFREGREEQGVADRLLLRAAVASSPRYPLEAVELPPYKEGCQDDPAKVACDYPETTLQKIVSTKWAEGDSSAVDLVKNFKWTNDDQNVVGKLHRRGRHVARGRR